MAVKPSTLGELEVTLLKMLIKTRNIVTSSVIRPGTISGGIRGLESEQFHLRLSFVVLSYP